MVTSRGIPVAPPRCGQCGFAFRPFDRHTAPAVLRACAARWQDILTDPRISRKRTGPRAWSPLEYGCHTRDMSELFHERLVKMLGIGPARFRIAPDPWSGAEFLRPYREEDPRRVAPELRRAAEDLARRFEELSQAGWDHPDPAAGDPRLSVEFFTSHFLHDVVHDLHEVSRLRGPEAAG